MVKVKKNKSRELVLGHLENISSKVFSDYPKAITELVANLHGVYALYKGKNLYYVGLATNLKSRVKHHLQDKHAGKWDKFSIYLVRKVDHIKELESLLLRIADPKGNAVKGGLPHAENLKKQLKSRIKKAKEESLKEMLGTKRKKTGTTKTKKKKVEQSGGKQPPLATYTKSRFPIRAVYKGQTYKATVRKDGTVFYNGKVYNSPSMAGQPIRKGACNGWKFWRFRNKKGEWVRLDELRK